MREQAKYCPLLSIGKEEPVDCLCDECAMFHEVGRTPNEGYCALSSLAYIGVCSD